MFDSSDSKRNAEEDLETFENRRTSKITLNEEKIQKQEKFKIEKEKIPTEPEIDEICHEMYKKLTKKDNLHYIKLKINPKNNFKLEIQTQKNEQEFFFENFPQNFENEPCYIILNFNFKFKEEEKKRIIFLCWQPKNCQIENLNFLYEHLHFYFLKKFDKLMIKIIINNKEDVSIEEFLNICKIWEKNFYSFFDEEN